jgi:amino-acid N-acetyltransferase
LVFGARPQIDAALIQDNIPLRFHKHVRVTDDETFSVIKQVCGGMQMDIMAKMSMGLINTPMAGAHLNVVSGNFVTSQPLGVDEGVDYFHGGRVRRVDADGIKRQLDMQNIVLISPLGFSVTGESFSVSSEEVASKVAIALNANKLISFCSHQGVINEKGEVVPELFPEQAEEYLTRLEELGDDSSGTARYFRSAIAACRGGVPRSHLVSYREDGALVQELFTRDGIGTQIVRHSAEQARQATIDDIGGILDLIRPLEAEGILVKRSREQLEMQIDNFFIIERDGMIISCAALYPFKEEAMAEMACVAVHPEYRSSNRGDRMVSQIEDLARSKNIKKLFVLTTRSIHWFRERGFEPVEVSALPMEKQRLYNYQRRSKILMKDL